MPVPVLITFGEWTALARAVEIPNDAVLDAAETAVLGWHRRGAAATLTEEEAVALAAFLVPLLRYVTDSDEGPATVVGRSAERTTGDSGEEHWLVTLEGRARDSVVHSGRWWDTEIRLTWRVLLPFNAPDLDKTRWTWNGHVVALPPPELAEPARGRLAARRQEKLRHAFEEASATITWTAGADWTPVGDSLGLAKI